MRWIFKFSNGFTGRGKACSIPVAMVFKRYYCPACGERSTFGQQRIYARKQKEQGSRALK